MWRPLRPRVKRELHRLQRGEINNIVIPTKWEFDEVDRRMRRFKSSLELLQPFEEEGDERLAEVIPIQPWPMPGGDYIHQRQLKVVGSDVDPDDRPSIQSRLDRPLVDIRIPNALSKLPKANPKGEDPEDVPGVDITHLTELLEFVLWLVSESMVVDVSDVAYWVRWQYGGGKYTVTEIATVAEAILD